MPGSSIFHWSWLKRPGVILQDGLLIPGKEAEPYYPGKHIKDLLNAVCKVADEQSALEFARQWGLLGFGKSAPEVEDRIGRFCGALDYNSSLRKKENPNVGWKTIWEEVARYFDPSATGRFANLTPRGESIAQMINFAEWVKHLSEVKRLLRLYQDDPHAADYDAKEWVKSLSPVWYKEFIGNLDFLREQYERGYSQPHFYQYVLDLVLHQARSSFSHQSRRGVWVQIYTSSVEGQPEGFPVLQFDGLFRFIEYVLLVEGGPSPKRCADPKCQRLFFPTKADQEYCPPPPGVKRSRCENRHGRELRRRGKGKKTRRKGEKLNAKESA